MLDSEMMDGMRMVERLVALCRDKHGEDVVPLDVRELVDYMDFLLIVTARSERQSRAIADHAIREMKKVGVLPLSKAGFDGGTWICIDFVDVVLHLFTPETRAYYDLELLWADAPCLDLPDPVPGDMIGDTR